MSEHSFSPLTRTHATRDGISNHATLPDRAGIEREARIMRDRFMIEALRNAARSLAQFSRACPVPKLLFRHRV